MPKHGSIRNVINFLTPFLGGFLALLVIFIILNTIFHFNYLRFPDFSYQPMDPVTMRTQVSPVDGVPMVYVPAGAFMMGVKQVDEEGSSDEKPLHEVDLDAFWIDQTEVTNVQYVLCVQAGVCEPPTAFGVVKPNSNTRPFYYGNPDFADYPVVYVNWYAAQAYCQWAGRRLPTEAEWEKAARGTDQRWYPWGDQNVAGTLVNLADRIYGTDFSFTLVNDGYYDTSPVGSYPRGASPYGALDMAGNVWEWTADWFSADYYAQSPLHNPTGPVEGSSRALRGGSFNNSNRTIRTTERSYLGPLFAYGYIGFRCAVSADATP